MEFFGINKLKKLIDIIKFNGGSRKAFLQVFRTDDLKIGTLVGTDKNGNKYYENNSYFVGTNRWVIYSDKFGLDYDGSQICPEWFGWLHYKTDLIPDKDPTRPKYKWMAEHTENFTGTPKQYVPYSTTRKKIDVWTPPSNLKK